MPLPAGLALTAVPAAGAAAGAAAGGGALSALGGPFGMLAFGIINAISQQRTNESSQNFARENREWELEQSNTAFQRGAADRASAGLNPSVAGPTGGAGTPSPDTPGLSAPSVSMPDMMAYGVSLKQLELAQQRIEIDKANSYSNISKNLSQEELNNVRKMLEQTGIPKAKVMGDTWGVLGSAVDSVKKSFFNPSHYNNPAVKAARERAKTDLSNQFGPPISDPFGGQ